MSRRPRTLLGGLVLALFAATLGITTTAGPAVGAPCVTKPDGAPDNVPKPADKRPPANAGIGQGAYFSYPNRSAADQVQIRNRVLNTINSTWGRRYTTPQTSTYTDPATSCTYEWISGWDYTRGTIRLATWSFNDDGVYKALVRAVQRGTLVQVVAAQGVNAEKQYRPWKQTYSYLNSKYAKFYDASNGAVQCTGACRGNGGTPHSKYFLFTDVGWTSANPNAPATSKITVQTSMNLTAFAFNGQWNSATVMMRPGVYNRFFQVFTQSYNKWRHSYERTVNDGVVHTFYPGGNVSAGRDPVLAALNRVRCAGAQSGGVNGRTRIRVIQYAIFDTRGVAIAKKLRSLWNAGCNVAIIYSVSSRPVLKILRARSGRGVVPMKQSVIKNRAGEIVKYNHSKWLAISGFYGNSRSNWMIMSGSANWSNFAYGCDEQMQEIFGSGWVAPFIRTFDTTWRQPSSRKPTYGGSLDGARIAARGTQASTFGYGQFRFMDND